MVVKVDRLQTEGGRRANERGYQGSTFEETARAGGVHALDASHGSKRRDVVSYGPSGAEDHLLSIMAENFTLRTIKIVGRDVTQDEICFPAPARKHRFIFQASIRSDLSAVKL